MRTARALTVSPSMLCRGGCTWSRGGTWSQRGAVCSWGVYLVWGCTCSGGVYLGWGVYLVQVGVCSLGGVPGPGGVYSGGVPGPGGCTWSRGGVPGPGGVYLVWGVSALGGCTWSGTPPCGQTHACEYITLPQTSFAGGNYVPSPMQQ